MRGQFTSADQALTAIFAGNARITLVSRRSGLRFTFKIRKPKPRRRGDTPPFFGSLLTGPDNGSDYTYIAICTPNGLRFTRGSRISADAPSARALDWALRKLNEGQIPADLEIWHEGRCCRCGRALTVPESIASGFGPECITKIGC